MYKSSLEYLGWRTQSTEKDFAKPEKKKKITPHFSHEHISVIIFLQKRRYSVMRVFFYFFLFLFFVQRVVG